MSRVATGAVVKVAVVKVAVVTGGSQGIGADLVGGYRRRPVWARRGGPDRN